MVYLGVTRSKPETDESHNELFVYIRNLDPIQQKKGFVHEGFCQVMDRQKNRCYPPMYVTA